ncbi:MAG: hypothetical protein Q8858_05615 [Bacteroidota bacterium]|nr:hypothetical protein [Bacteroidota bacterium]
MKKRSLKIFIPVLISIALFVIASKKTRSCGPELAPDDYYTIFDKSIFKLPDLQPFFLSENTFADQKDGSEESETDNLKQWLKFLNGVPSLDHIEDVIYKTDQDELKKIRQYLISGDISLLPSKLKDNSFIKYLESIKSKGVMDYLIYAKQCEPEVTSGNYWEEKKKDTVLMHNLIKTGIMKYHSTKSRFIKDRYAYQAVRLAHYSGQYKMAIDLYNRFFKEKKDLSLIQYWSLAHKAGAQHSLGKLAEANLTFAHIFDKCRSRKRQCMLSIELGTDSLFNETFKLCKDNHDRVLIYTLAAYRNPDKSLKYMDLVFSLEPESEYLELLLAREVTKLERRILPTKANWEGQRYYIETNTEQTSPIDDELFNKVSSIAKTGKVKSPYLWDFASGYIATLINKTEEAKQFYFAAKKSCPKDDLSFLRRIQVAEIVSEVKGLKSIDKKAEDEISGDIIWLHELAAEEKFNAKDALVYVMNILAKKYWKQGDNIKANLCLGLRISEKNEYWGYYDNKVQNAFGYNIRNNYHLEPIDAIYKLISSKYKYDDWYRPNSEYNKKYSRFERFLIDNYLYSPSELEYIQAKSFIAKGEFGEAVKRLSPEDSYTSYYNDMTEKLPADPFVVHIRDCHDCDYNAVSINRYSVLSFSKRMLELERLAASDTANAAQYYYLIANGLYNKSYYGNSWVASAFFRRSSPWGYYDGFNRDFYDCSQAMNYYLKAMSHAKDREFAAKCLYMASKCELNSFFNSADYAQMDNIEVLSVPLKYRTSFIKLKSNYYDTKYYQEILHECKYFYNFVSR